MSLPLATLWRHSSLILLRERSGSLFDAPAAPEAVPEARPHGTGADVHEARRLAFSSVEDADAYLRFWKGEVAAISQLRSALHRCGHSARVFACSDYEVIRALASQVVRGSLVLTEGTLPYPPVDWLVVPASARHEPAPATRAASPQVPLRSIPAARPLPPPLLPLLEEVQIEGAEVLPEIMQTLEQIDLTMGSIDLAAVSLEPTPSGVPQIDSAMQQASDSVTATLDGL